MEGILGQLGVNWRLLLTQGVNFFVLLILLNFLVYRPLIKMMDERKKKIEFGLKGAEEAEKKLSAIEKIKTERLAQTDKKALGIISSAEDEAKKRAQGIAAEARKKAELALHEAAAAAERKKMEELAKLADKAKDLIRAAIAKTVELDPKLIDEKLAGEAAEMIKKAV